MNREEFVKQFNTTDKRFVRLNMWGEGIVEILYIGQNEFFGIDDDGHECSWRIDHTWLPYTPPQEELFYWEYKEFVKHNWCLMTVKMTEKEAKVNLDKYTEYRKIEFIKPSK